MAFYLLFALVASYLSIQNWQYMSGRNGMIRYLAGIPPDKLVEELERLKNQISLRGHCCSPDGHEKRKHVGCMDEGQGSGDMV